MGQRMQGSMPFGDFGTFHTDTQLCIEYKKNIQHGANSTLVAADEKEGDWIFCAKRKVRGGVGKVQSQTCISFQMQGMNRLVEKYESEIFFFCFSTQNKDRSSESKFSFKIFQKKVLSSFSLYQICLSPNKIVSAEKGKIGTEVCKKTSCNHKFGLKTLAPFPQRDIFWISSKPKCVIFSIFQIKNKVWRTNSLCEVASRYAAALYLVSSLLDTDGNIM